MEAGSLLFIGRLTRSITRTVKDTYKATKQVEAGNLSHRIPIRANDQLNSLAASFNDMAENVQRLIAEVKDKERQDLELQIAREVQLGLFPEATAPLGKSGGRGGFAARLDRSAGTTTTSYRWTIERSLSSSETFREKAFRPRF